MSHSIPLRRKIVVAFLLPIVALAAIAAVGVADATQDAELGESARTSFDQVARLQEAAVAVADERLATVLQEIDGQQGSDIDVEDAILTTDVAMDQLSVLGDELLNDRVWSALGAARTTPVGRSESYARATETLLDAAAQINVETVSSHAALLLDDLQRIHRLIEADDNAWLAFAARTSEDVRSTTEVAQFFAVAAAIRDDLDM
ncbi:MAG: hypothetical protein KJN63_04020, partial [Acidimicrobiia bacterium]|nr:hypothetical protein [Acidimicrobiia bacterium]